MSKPNDDSNDSKPDELFKRMVLNNYKQNQRLRGKFHKDSSSSITKHTDQNVGKKDTKIRFIVCTLGLFACTMSQMSRYSLNLSITSMVDSSMLNQNAGQSSTDDSCPWPEKEKLENYDEIDKLDSYTTPSSILSTYFDPLELYSSTETFNDTIVTTRAGLQSSDLEELTESDDKGSNERFKWTMQEQSLLLGGFHYSYFFFMILGKISWSLLVFYYSLCYMIINLFQNFEYLGGRMSEIYGAKYLLIMSVAGSALITLATPWIARYSFTLLVISRILMGIFQSGLVPSIYALFANWLTMSELSIYTALLKVSFNLGSLFVSIVYGQVTEWQSLFLIVGAIGFLWSLLWLLIATSSPLVNMWVSETELQHILKKKRQQEKPLEMSEKNNETSSKSDKQTPSKKQVNTPWIKIITAPSVIGLVIIKYTHNCMLAFLSIELPSYLKYVHHASNQTISITTTIMFSTQAALIVFVGWLAKSMIKQRTLGLSKTMVRKIFQGLSSYGIGIAMLLITINDCNITYVCFMIQVISFLSMFTVGGEAMLPYDLSDKYPATIVAIGNSAGKISDMTITTFASLILGDKGGSNSGWNILISLIAVLNILGGVAFSTLVKAKPIDLETPEKMQNSSEKEENQANGSA